MDAVLCLVVMAAMWFWVVRQRGHWNLLLANLAGAGSAVVAGIVFTLLYDGLFGTTMAAPGLHNSLVVFMTSAGVLAGGAADALQILGHVKIGLVQTERLDQIGVAHRLLLASPDEDAETLEAVRGQEAPARYVARVTGLKLDAAVQRLHRRQVARYRRGLFAGDQLGAEKQLQAGLLAELVQRRTQRLGLDVEGISGLCGLAANGHSTDRQGQRQGAKAWERFVVVHVVETSWNAE